MSRAVEQNGRPYALRREEQVRIPARWMGDVDEDDYGRQSLDRGRWGVMRVEPDRLVRQRARQVGDERIDHRRERDDESFLHVFLPGNHGGCRRAC